MEMLPSVIYVLLSIIGVVIGAALNYVLQNFWMNVDTGEI